MIFRSHYPEVDIPSGVSLPRFLVDRARRLSEKPAFIDGETGTVRTFGQVIRDSRRVAAGLTASGLQPGEVIAIYSPNNFDWPLAYYGALLAGGVVTPVNPLLTSGELQRQLEDTGAVMIVTVPELLERVEAASASTSLRGIITFGEAAGAIPFDELLLRSPIPPVVAVDPEDVCLLPVSSGTTGPPKPVMLSHEAVVASICQMLGVQVWREDDTLIGAVPFFHRAGIDAYLHAGFATGATMVLLPRYDLEQMLQTIEQYRVTSTLWVPPILQAMTKDPRVDLYDLSSLTSVHTAAAPAGRELEQRFTSRLKCELRQVYGMTEFLPVTTTPAGEIALGSAGAVNPNTEVKIVDIDSGAELGPNQTGEIWARGKQMMKGYLNLPDATALAITPDGWMRTGDIGYADENGFFYIVDRLKEFIKYKGYQVASAELEDVLKGHPAIVDAAVVGSLDEAVGELPKAFVVREAPLTEQEIIDYVAERVAPYKKVRLVEFIDAIPKNPSGKILRRALIERERERGAAPA